MYYLLRIFLITAFFGGLFTGCGKEQIDIVNDDVEFKKVTGTVIDGNIEGATVFLDMNGSGELDNSEPFAITNNSGDYELKLNEEQFECRSYVPLIAHVPKGASDSNLGIVEDPYYLFYPPFLDKLPSNVNISALTSLVWDVFKVEFFTYDATINSFTIGCDEIKDNAYQIEKFSSLFTSSISSVVDTYNISDHIIFEDYTNNGNSVVQGLAELIIKGSKRGYKESNEIAGASLETYVEVKYLKVDENWAKSEFVLSLPKENDGWSSAEEIRSTIHSVSDDFEIVGELIEFYNRSGSSISLDGDLIAIGETEDACSKSEYYRYAESVTANEVNEREIVNVVNSCGKENSKYISHTKWEKYEERIGTVAQFEVKYDDSIGQFAVLPGIGGFSENQLSLDFAGFNDLIDSLNYHYDYEIDNFVELKKMFSRIVLLKKTKENNLRVDYQKVFEGEGWSYITYRINIDGSFSQECKGVGETVWSDCE
jgi:hypothetical protein